MAIPADCSKLVVIKPGALGDTLLLAPALRALRKARPALKINVVGSLPAVGLLKGLGVADAVFAIDHFNLYAPSAKESQLLQGASVLAFMALEAGVRADLQRIAGAARIVAHPARPARPGPHVAVYLHQCLGYGFPEIRPLSRAAFALRRAPRMAAAGNYAVLAPGAGSAAKRAPMSVFEGIARQLSQQGIHPIFIAGEVEIAQGLLSHYPNSYRCCRNLSLEGLAQLLWGARAAFTNDSGPAHLAGMIGIPTTVFFGPTDPAVWRPWGPQVSIHRF